MNTTTSPHIDAGSTGRGRRLALAAAALCLASAFASCGSEDPSAEPSDASETATSSPTPDTTATPSPTETPSEIPGGIDRGPLDVGDLEQGAPPAVAHATLDYRRGQQRGGTIHAVDDGSTPLPAFSLVAFAPLGDGWVVDMVDPDGGEEMVFLLDADGSHGKPYAAEGGLAVSPGGNVVAWTGVDGTVHAAHAATGEVLTMAKVPRNRGSYRTVGVTSDDCQEGRSTDAGCTVYVNSDKAWFTSSHGIVDRVPRAIVSTTAHGDLLGVMVSVDENEPGSCSRMERRWKRIWRTCDHTLDAISPDETHLVGLPAYLDGFGPQELALLSTTDGRPVQSWTGSADSATYFDQVWEDDQHVLVRTFEDDRWAVVRVGLDGSLEYAVAPVAGEDLASPLLLQTR